MRPSSPDSTSFASAARALASPVSPTSDAPPPPPPPRSSSFSSAGRPAPRRGSSSASQHQLGVLDEDPLAGLRRTSSSASRVLADEQPWALRAARRADQAGRAAWAGFLRLSRGQQAIVALAATGMLAAMVVLLVYNERIYVWLYPYTQRFAAWPPGWAVLWLFIVSTAFPPMMGYSTAVTMCGFIYGMKGWLICATANVAGSLLSFLVFRRYLSGFSARLAARDPRFAAFNLVLARDGLPLLVAIRLCPLPYSLSNAALSTLPPVRAMPFALATAAATPKLLIHVFVGGRLAAIAAGDQDGMDPGAKAANYAGIAAGAFVGLATGIIIYRRTVARARQLEAEQAAAAEEEEGLAGGFDDGDDAGAGWWGGRPKAAGLAHPDAFAEDAPDGGDGSDDPWARDEERERRDEINFLDADANGNKAGRG